MTRTYAVRPPVAGFLAGVAAVAWVLTIGAELPGRFLYGVLAVAATAEAVRAVALRPTLRADADGFDVVVGLRRERHAWTDVEDVAALRPPSGGGHLRRRANALEIDLGDRLVVVPAYRLGCSGALVAEEIATVRGASY